MSPLTGSPVFILRAFLPAAIAAAVLFAGAPARGQGDPSNANEFVRGLSELGLDGVVMRLLEDPPDNPERAKELRDALAAGWVPRQATTSERFLDAVERVIQLDKNLPRPEGVHWAEPIWDADLAQTLLFSALPGLQEAGDFVMFGVPSRGQSRATAKVAETAYRRLNRAEDTFVGIQLQLRRQRDFVNEYVNTGRWDRLTRYMNLNVPYYRAWAAGYLLAEGPEGPYFAGEEDAQRRYTRLLNGVSRDVASLVEDRDNLGLHDDNLARLDILAATLAVERGEPDAAVVAAERADDHEQARPYSRFLAKLAQAKALQAAGETDKAAQLVDALADDQYTRENPYRMVLVADRRFLLIFSDAEAMDEARAKAERLADAFEVYDRLLKSEPMAPWAGPMRTFVESRYERQVPAWAEGELLPPTVRFAGVRRDIVQAERLRVRDAEAAAALYRRVFEETDAMLEGEDLGYEPEFESTLRYFQGLALYRLEEYGPAADQLLVVADKFPDLPRGEESIRFAYGSIVRPLYVKARDHEAWITRMSTAFKLVIEKYPNIPLAERARYHRAAFFREQGRHVAAIKAYLTIERGHPNYFAARYEELVSRANLWNDPPAPLEDGEEENGEGGAVAPEGDGVGEGGEADEAALAREARRLGGADAVIEAASTFIELANGRIESSDPDVPENIGEMVANAYLIRAQVLLRDRNDPEAAERDLDAVAERFGDVEGVRNRITQTRIRALQEQGKYVEAERRLRGYMEQEPDRAAPLAAGVLGGLVREAERRAGRGGELGPIVDAAVKLADSLVLPWARQQPFTVPQKLAFEIMPARALVIAERWQAALDRFDSIIERYDKAETKPASSNLDVVLGRAKAQYHLEDYRTAYKGFEKVFEALGNEGPTGGAMPPEFWESVLFMAETQDQWADGENRKIYSWLEGLNRKYDGLGPAPYEDRLADLRQKHRP